MALMLVPGVEDPTPVQDSTLGQRMYQLSCDRSHLRGVRQSDPKIQIRGLRMRDSDGVEPMASFPERPVCQPSNVAYA